MRCSKLLVFIASVVVLLCTVRAHSAHADHSHAERYSGSSCGCDSKSPAEAQIPVKEIHKPNAHGYKIEVPQRPTKAEVKYKFDFQMETPRIDQSRIESDSIPAESHGHHHQLEYPSRRHGDHRGYKYGYDVEIPVPTTETDTKNSITKIDKIVIRTPEIMEYVEPENQECTCHIQQQHINAPCPIHGRKEPSIGETSYRVPVTYHSRRSRRGAPKKGNTKFSESDWKMKHKTNNKKHNIHKRSIEEGEGLNVDNYRSAGDDMQYLDGAFKTSDAGQQPQQPAGSPNPLAQYNPNPLGSFGGYPGAGYPQTGYPSVPNFGVPMGYGPMAGYASSPYAPSTGYPGLPSPYAPSTGYPGLPSLYPPTGFSPYGYQGAGLPYQNPSVYPNNYSPWGSQYNPAPGGDQSGHDPSEILKKAIASHQDFFKLSDHGSALSQPPDVQRREFMDYAQKLLSERPKRYGSGRGESTTESTDYSFLDKIKSGRYVYDPSDMLKFQQESKYGVQSIGGDSPQDGGFILKLLEQQFGSGNEIEKSGKKPQLRFLKSHKDGQLYEIVAQDPGLQ